MRIPLRRFPSPLAPALAVALTLLAAPPRAHAAEFTSNGTYNSQNYTTSVFVDDAIPAGQVRGVIVAFNYGGADQAYTKPIWRNFARDRNLALCLMANQDTFGTPAIVSAGQTVLNDTLAGAATALGRSELAASTLPLIFVGISRGGTSGAINFGWTYGANRTVACLAYHGNSFNYLDTSFLKTNSTTAANAIPVFYPAAQLDSGPYRQTDIETAVRTTNTTTLNGSIGATVFGFRPRYGLPWTTTMQYGSSHASLGDDTYPLQWLGRVWAARYNPTTPGTLAVISANASLSGNYVLTNGASSNATYASPSVGAFVTKDANIWLPPGGGSDWLAETTPPAANTPLSLDTTTDPVFTAPDTLINRNFVNAGNLTFSGNGTIALDNGSAGSRNAFRQTGGTIRLLNGVTLKNGAFQGGNWTDNRASLFVDATSTLDLSDGSAVHVDALTGSGNVTVGVTTGSQILTLGVNDGNGTFSGRLLGRSTLGAGSLALVKTGNGTQILSGPNAYVGGTTISGGRLELSGNGTLGTGNLTIANGATLALGNTAGAVADNATVALAATARLDVATGVTERFATLTVNGTVLEKGAWNAARDPARFSGGGRLFIVTPGLNALQDWRQRLLGSTANSGNATDSADPDRDGLPNLLEFAVGTSPTSPDALPATVDTAAGQIRLTYRRSHTADADGTLYIVEWSDTLANDWSQVGVTQSAVPGTDTGLTQAYLATVPTPPAGTRRFLRLRVTHP